MIQEKDFLYRVPVKNALVTAPGKQVRNPEILVDLEGGEFMHGDILDANSTNKLIDQSVKDAIDNSTENGNYVTKDLLEAETSARTKSDEDLNAKIKAEQTRAEGKEKEISDKLAIVDGDSNTEGSFRKAIADVIAAAPEDLDTLKEIADKLAGNDDLHTALNQAITEKADASALANEISRAIGVENDLRTAIDTKPDASALANEISRATGVENDLRTAIDTKPDATALSNYVLTTALNQQIDTLNAAISAKQDAGNYVPYTQQSGGGYEMERGFVYNYTTPGNAHIQTLIGGNISMQENDGPHTYITAGSIFVGYPMLKDNSIDIIPESVTGSINGILSFKLNENGVLLNGGDNNHVLTSNASTIDITQYAKKSELPTVPTKVSQLTNDSNFITQQDADDKYALVDTVSSFSVGLSKKQNKITVNNVDTTDIETADITKLRTIVTNLINALSASDLIRETKTLE